jgi:hypothetical protein
MLEGLVDDVYAIMQKQYIYKRNAKGQLVTSLATLAVQSHGASIWSFRRTKEAKSKLPHDFWK